MVSVNLLINGLIFLCLEFTIVIFIHYNHFRLAVDEDDLKWVANYNSVLKPLGLQENGCTGFSGGFTGLTLEYCINTALNTALKLDLL